MVEWVEDNIMDSPTLDEMSEYVGYSSFYCSSKFHEHVGLTFKTYVAKRKINLASFELKNTNRRVIDIAMEYGFSSQEAFTRAFVKAYGCTPKQFRKQTISLQ